LTFVLNDPGDRALDLVDDPDLPCSQPPLSDPTEELARVIGDSETFFAFHLGILDRPTIISTSPALFHNTVTSTMPTLQRDDDQDIELETTKKLDAQHDEFIDADADADAARAQQDDKDAGMWSEWQNLGILETFKTFRFTCLLCMMAAFSAATDGYQVRRLSFLTVTLFFFFPTCLFVRTHIWVYLLAFPTLLPLYALHPYPPSLFPSSTQHPPRASDRHQREHRRQQRVRTTVWDHHRRRWIRGARCANLVRLELVHQRRADHCYVGFPAVSVTSLFLEDSLSIISELKNMMSTWSG
jgi:hypothetical protein